MALEVEDCTQPELLRAVTVKLVGGHHGHATEGEDDLRADRGVMFSIFQGEHVLGLKADETESLWKGVVDLPVEVASALAVGVDPLQVAPRVEWCVPELRSQLEADVDKRGTVVALDHGATEELDVPSGAIVARPGQRQAQSGCIRHVRHDEPTDESDVRVRDAAVRPVHQEAGV